MELWDGRKEFTGYLKEITREQNEQNRVYVIKSLNV